VATTLTGLRVDEIGADLSREQLDGLLTVQRAVDAELEPGDPPIPAQELRAHLFEPQPRIHRRAWLATLDGAPVGSAAAEREVDGVNDALVDVTVQVLPARRRGGIGRALVRVALSAAAAEGCTSVLGWMGVPAGAAFAGSLGMTHRQDDRCSRLRIDDLDPDQQRRWRDDAPGRAAGYRLVSWVGVCPDRWAGSLADAFRSMTDAPLDDVDYDPQSLTAAEVQERDRAWDRAGFDPVSSLALAPDGTAAGASQIIVSRLRPPVAHQEDTGVVAAHRGQALGRWLKSENLRRALEHNRDVEVVQTFNAESNPHMLAINVGMGFRPYRSYAVWQGSIADALVAVDAA
jgi:GNAT superfamily N-acetyltransferase